MRPRGPGGRRRPPPPPRALPAPRPAPGRSPALARIPPSPAPRPGRIPRRPAPAARRSRQRSYAKERRLALALEMDVEPQPVSIGRRHHCRRLLGRQRREHGIPAIGGLVRQVEAGQHRLQEAAREHQHVRCGACPRRRAGASRTKYAAVLVGAAAAEAGAQRLLPHLHHGVGHRLARPRRAPARSMRNRARRARRRPVRSADRAHSPNEKNGPTVCDGVRCGASAVLDRGGGAAAQHDVEAVAERPLRRRSCPSRAPPTRRSRGPDRGSTGRSGRSRTAGRRGSTSASPGGR